VELSCWLEKTRP
jgi:hypothetical protein